MVSFERLSAYQSLVVTARILRDHWRTLIPVALVAHATNVILIVFLTCVFHVDVEPFWRMHLVPNKIAWNTATAVAVGQNLLCMLLMSIADATIIRSVVEEYAGSSSSSSTNFTTIPSMMIRKLIQTNMILLFLYSLPVLLSRVLYRGSMNLGQFSTFFLWTLFYWIVLSTIFYSIYGTVVVEGKSGLKSFARSLKLVISSFRQGRGGSIVIPVILFQFVRIVVDIAWFRIFSRSSAAPYRILEILCYVLLSCIGAILQSVVYLNLRTVADNITKIDLQRDLGEHYLTFAVLPLFHLLQDDEDEDEILFM